MKPDFKNILLEVLNIIDYKDDKEKFTNEMLQLAHDEAIVALLEKLPLCKKEELKKSFSRALTPEEAKDIIEHYTTFEEYKKSLQKTSDKLFQDYILTILPTLSKDQKQKLEDSLVSVKEKLEKIKKVESDLSDV